MYFRNQKRLKYIYMLPVLSFQYKQLYTYTHAKIVALAWSDIGNA